MSNSKITLLGLYQYMQKSDDDLFKELTLPDSIDKELVINSILMNNAEFEVLYSNPYFMQSMIGIWSNKWVRTFERWFDALIKSEYDPIENYDRKEEWRDNGTSSGTDSASGSVENKVSAFDSSSYQPDNTTSTKNDAKSNATSENVHSGRVHGNIGVTTNAQMIQGDVNTHKMLNLYNLISDTFKAELLVSVY